MTLWWYTNTFVYYYYYYANYGRVSVCHKSVFYRNCCTDRAGFLARRLSSKGNPSGNLPRTLDFEYFASASRSCCQQSCSRSSLLTTLTTVDASWPDAHSLSHVRQCSRITYFTFFFRFQRATLYVFFQMTCQKVVSKSLVLNHSE